MNGYNNICIVGNKLNAFSNNANVFTLDEFLSLLKLEKKTGARKYHYSVHIGQGLNDASLALIFSTIKTENLSKKFIFSNITEKTQRASLESTHKHHVKNIMVSKSKKISETKFESYLMLDENCAEMSDHISGQHLQGMVMIEAARQMINSLTEEHLLTEQQKNNSSYVLNHMKTQFHDYIFPLEVKMVCELIKLRRVPSGDFTTDTKISIFQSNELTMEIDLSYSVFNKEYIKEKEKNMAIRALKKVFDFLPVEIGHETDRLEASIARGN